MVVTPDRPQMHSENGVQFSACHRGSPGRVGGSRERGWQQDFSRAGRGSPMVSLGIVISGCHLTNLYEVLGVRC